MKTLYISVNTEATGKNIKRIMDQRGYVVKDIQSAMGFENPQAVYKWLSGQSMPNLDNLIILSRVLDVSLDEIPVIDGDSSIQEKNKLRSIRKKVLNRYFHDGLCTQRYNYQKA